MSQRVHVYSLLTDSGAISAKVFGTRVLKYRAYMAFSVLERQATTKRNLRPAPGWL